MLHSRQDYILSTSSTPLAWLPPALVAPHPISFLPITSCQACPLLLASLAGCSPPYAGFLLMLQLLITQLTM